jgi:ubiquinone/menaquinone biosynthesis C-methylase UbiE
VPDHSEPEFDRYAQRYDELLRDPIRDRFAAGGEFFFTRKWDLIEAYFSRAGRDLKSVRWLDVGCGQGDLLRVGASRVGEACGCDPSAGMLTGCEGLDVRPQPDLGKLPFPSESFNFVTAVCVYHHVPPDARVGLMREMARVLQPGGTACVIEHNPFNPATQVIVRRTPVDADAKLLTAGMTRRVMRKTRLTPNSTEYFLYFPEGLYGKLKAMESALSGVALGGQYAVFARKAAN